MVDESKSIKIPLAIWLTRKLIFSSIEIGEAQELAQGGLEGLNCLTMSSTIVIIVAKWLLIRITVAFDYLLITICSKLVEIGMLFHLITSINILIDYLEILLSICLLFSYGILQFLSWVKLIFLILL